MTLAASVCLCAALACAQQTPSAPAASVLAGLLDPLTPRIADIDGDGTREVERHASGVRQKFGAYVGEQCALLARRCAAGISADTPRTQQRREQRAGPATYVTNN